MNIGINFSYKLIASRGIARFTENIISNIPENKHTYFFFIPKECHFNVPFSFSKNLNFIEIECNNYFVFEHLKVPKMVKQYKIDVLINPANTVPVRRNTKWVTVIHDVIPFKLKSKPLTKKWFVNMYMRTILKKAITGSSHLVTVSEYSKSDIHSLGYKHKDISVVYNGFNHKNLKQEFVSIPDLPEHYIFWLGGDGYNKNMDAIVQLLQRNKCGIDIVVVGVKKDINVQILRKLGAHVYVDVSDGELETIYKKADLFLFPSFYEGFGIPVLEAMNYNVPYIIASNATSVPEVCGNACILIDPHDINGIEETINKVLNQEVESKVSLYAEQLGKFNWSVEANKFYNIITG